MSLLVAVDDSRAAEVAFERALQLANGKELFVLTVQPDLDPAVYSLEEGIAFAAMEAHQKGLREASMRVLQKFGNLAKGRPVKLLLGHGDLAETIVAEAKARNADIVIGRRAALSSAVTRLFSTSVSMRVVEEADCNVVVVHEK